MTSGPDYMQRRDDGPFDGDQHRADQETAHLLQQLTEHPGWDELTRVVGKRISVIERTILAGTATDHGDYLGKVAYVKGLKEVVETPAVLAAKVATRHTNRPPQEVEA